jgi:hypothetical protein
MGVEFVAYSNVIIKPIPIKYRSNVKKLSLSDHQETLNKIKTIESLNKDMEGAISLYCVMNGIGVDQKHGSIECAPDVEISEESQKWCDEIKKTDPEFICVDWINNRMFFKTLDTEKMSTGSHYSDYYDLIKELEKIIGRKLRYVLPTTDSAPENGIAYGENLRLMYDDFHLIETKYNDVLTKWWKEDECKFEFFGLLRDMLNLGSNNGIIEIS